MALVRALVRSLLGFGLAHARRPGAMRKLVRGGAWTRPTWNVLLARLLGGAMFKSLSAVQKALGALPAAMEPSRVNGKWHAPKFSRRKLAELRKAALGFDLPWDWDRERKPVREREPKGHKHDRERPMREAKIAAALAKQPELVAAYRAKRKIVPTTLERLTMSTAELVLKRRTAVNPEGKK